MGQTLSRPDMCFDAAMVYVGDVETLTCWNNSEATSKRLFVYEDQKRIESVLLIRTRTVSFESRPHRTTAQTFFCFVLFIAEFSGQLCWFDVTAPGWKGLLKWSPMLSDKKRQKTKQKTGFIWFFSLCPPAREEKSNKQSWFLLLTSNLCTSSSCRSGFPGRWRGWGANSGCIS